MRGKLLWVMALCGLLSAGATTRADEAPEAAKPRGGKPTVVVRVASLDDLISTFRYLAKLAGREEQAKQLEGILQARTGPKGLEGVDTKKPWGFYGILDANLPASEGVLMVPVADRKAVLDQLDRLNVKAEKGKDDLYTVTAEGVPFPIYLRFANGYAYATARNRGALAKGRLRAPGMVFPAGEKAMAALELNIDEIPNGLKEMFLGQLDLRLADAKEEAPPGETEAQKKLRLALIEEAGRRLKMLVQEGGAARMRLTIDQKKGEITFNAGLAGKKGSALAKDIAALGGGRSLAAGLVSETSAVHFLVDARLPERLRKALAPVIDDVAAEAVKKQDNEEQRALLEKFLDAVKPTAKAGELDAGMDIRGPGPGGHYTVVAGVKVRKGLALEKVLKEALKKVPAEARKALEVDFAKEGGVNIHKVTVRPRDLDKGAREVLGEGPMFFAIRNNALLFAGGEDALAAIKSAIKAKPKKTVALLQVEVSMARIAKLMARQQKSAPEAARKVFGKDARGQDIVRIRIEGGKALQFSLLAKAKIVTFISTVDKMEKGEE
jgi:hypothetical protein